MAPASLSDRTPGGSIALRWACSTSCAARTRRRSRSRGRRSSRPRSPARRFPAQRSRWGRGWTGWTEVQSSSQTIDLRGTGAREDVEEVLREHGIDPDKKGQTIDASTVPGLQEAILGALGASGLKIPNAGGFGGGISPPKQDPLAQIEHLDKQRDAGAISDAEFEAQKQKLLGG